MGSEVRAQGGERKTLSSSWRDLLFSSQQGEKGRNPEAGNVLPLAKEFKGAIVFETLLPNWPLTATSEATDTSVLHLERGFFFFYKETKNTPEDTEA